MKTKSPRMLAYMLEYRIIANSGTKTTHEHTT